MSGTEERRILQRLGGNVEDLEKLRPVLLAVYEHVKKALADIRGCDFHNRKTVEYDSIISLGEGVLVHVDELYDLITGQGVASNWFVDTEGFFFRDMDNTDVEFADERKRRIDGVTPADMLEVSERILAEKPSVQKQVADFWYDLINERQEALHPDDVIAGPPANNDGGGVTEWLRALLNRMGMHRETGGGTPARHFATTKNLTDVFRFAPVVRHLHVLCGVPLPYHMYKTIQLTTLAGVLKTSNATLHAALRKIQLGSFHGKTVDHIPNILQRDLSKETYDFMASMLAEYTANGASQLIVNASVRTRPRDLECHIGLFNRIGRFFTRRDDGGVNV